MNNSFNRILLSQNNFLINDAIKHEADKLQMLSKLPALLKPFGLDAGEAKKLNWTALAGKIKDTFLFPKATEEHNLNCMGLAKEFHDLKEYYLLNTWCLNARVLTQEDKDALVEQYRTYTSNEKQNEAIHLFNTVKDSLLRLKELGIDIDLSKAYLLSRVFAHEVGTPLKIDVNQLQNKVINLN